MFLAFVRAAETSILSAFSVLPPPTYQNIRGLLCENVPQTNMKHQTKIDKNEQHFPANYI